MKEKDKAEKNSIIIIGAGLTGLVTAFYLKNAGYDVLILEKRNRPGGVINTVTEGDFIYEEGPNTGVLGHPEVAELFDDLKGIQPEVAREEAKKRYVFKKGKWRALPGGLRSGITTPLFSFWDKFRILGEPFRKAGNNPNETLAELVKRRMGKSFLDYAVDPFILGIYAGDPAYLVPKYALPKLYNLEQNYGSFIKGAVRKAKEPKSERERKATRQIFSVNGGLSGLINELVAQIGHEHILTGVQGVKVNKPEADVYRVEWQTREGREEAIASQVASTISPTHIQQVFPFFKQEQLSPLLELPYAKVVQVALGFSLWQGMPLDAFGGLVPFKEGKDVLGVLFISSFLSGRAPDGGAMLSVFLGGYRKPEVYDWDDEKIRQYLADELPAMMDMPDFNPDMIRIMRYDAAIPQYGKNSSERLESIEEIQHTYPGIWLAGNIKDGIGMADRIRQGKMLADQVINA